MKTIAVVLAFSVSPLLAHDMWLEPRQFSGRTGEPVALRLFVGERLKPEGQGALAPNRITRFEMFDDGRIVDLLEQESTGNFPSGSGVVVMERRPAYITLQPEKFMSYLVEEGHENAVVTRPVRERYTRHLKMIVSGSGAKDRDYRHVFGLRLEIIPESDPRKGRPISVLIQFDGKPLAGARVDLATKSGPVSSVKTDADGRARFTSSVAGVTLVRTTMLRPCHCSDADYESFWSALTFEANPIGD